MARDLSALETVAVQGKAQRAGGASFEDASAFGTLIAAAVAGSATDAAAGDGASAAPPLQTAATIAPGMNAATDVANQALLGATPPDQADLPKSLFKPLISNPALRSPVLSLVDAKIAFVSEEPPTRAEKLEITKSSTPASKPVRAAKSATVGLVPGAELAMAIPSIAAAVRDPASPDVPRGTPDPHRNVAFETAPASASFVQSGSPHVLSPAIVVAPHQAQAPTPAHLPYTTRTGAFDTHLSDANAPNRFTTSSDQPVTLMANTHQMGSVAVQVSREKNGIEVIFSAPDTAVTSTLFASQHVLVSDARTAGVALVHVAFEQGGLAQTGSGQPRQRERRAPTRDDIMSTRASAVNDVTSTSTPERFA